MIWTRHSRPIYRYALITLALVAPFALITPVYAQSADTLPLVMTLQADFQSYSPDRSKILTTNDRTAKVWDASNGKLLMTLEHQNLVVAAAYNPNGSRIVTASWDNRLKVWDASSGKLLKTLEGHKDYISFIAYSPDGSRILTASYDGTAKVWDASSGRLLMTLEGHTDFINSAAYSPNGSRIVTASWDNTAKVWDASSGRLLNTLQGHTDHVFSAVYSPNGSRIVTLSVDGTAKVWDASNGKLLQTLEGHTEWVQSAAYSPDGSRILTASADGTAKVWDASSGKLLKTLKGHTDHVFSAVYSPNGSRIVTASWDKTAKVWDASSGKLLKTLKGHKDYVYSAAFSPDGSRIVTASFDDTTKVWDASSLSGSSAPTLPVTKPKLTSPSPAAGSNMAQTVLNADTCSTMYSSLDAIYYTQRGEFSNPDKYVFESNKPYSVQCGSTIFSSNGKNSAYIKSNSIDNLFKAIASVDSPYFNFHISFFAGYKYESIKQGFFDYSESVRFCKNEFEYFGFSSREDELGKTTYGNIISGDSIVGYKINNGPLKQLAFKGKGSIINYQMGDVIEIFAKGSSFIQTKYVKLDTKNFIPTVEKEKEFSSQ